MAEFIASVMQDHMFCFFLARLAPTRRKTHIYTYFDGFFEGGVFSRCVVREEGGNRQFVPRGTPQECRSHPEFPRWFCYSSRVVRRRTFRCPPLEKRPKKPN